mmetsp:Transcript_19278/g.48566  ORF Transcript_19278/g.48566 Transcript_19278/m.48566 type:complete len:213 (+) Transcript_19278:1685-2323(+)
MALPRTRNAVSECRLEKRLSQPQLLPLSVLTVPLPEAGRVSRSRRASHDELVDDRCGRGGDSGVELVAALPLSARRAISAEAGRACASGERAVAPSLGGFLQPTESPARSTPAARWLPNSLCARRALSASSAGAPALAAPGPTDFRRRKRRQETSRRMEEVPSSLRVRPTSAWSLRDRKEGRRGGAVTSCSAAGRGNSVIMYAVECQRGALG